MPAPAGHVLWQGTYEDTPEEGGSRLVAVLCWGGAAKRLKDRDDWVGRDAVTCANRLKLVVQVRRFAVPDMARRPNLASECLGLAQRQLAVVWQKHHGYRPLLAYGLLGGAPDVNAIWSKCGPLNQARHPPRRPTAHRTNRRHPRQRHHHRRSTQRQKNGIHLP